MISTIQGTAKGLCIESMQVYLTIQKIKAISYQYFYFAFARFC